jgi:hypothetical protein
MNSFGDIFTPLQGALGNKELEDRFDLRIKFEEKESDESRVDPITGIRAHAEPLLALYVSVAPRGSNHIPITLNYARTRSRFVDRVNATKEDGERLVQAAIPAIILDLQMLLVNQQPRNMGKPLWL